MPKDDKRKELTQEEIDAQNEKFRTFFSTSVAQVPEEMKRRDEEKESTGSLLGKLFHREKDKEEPGNIHCAATCTCDNRELFFSYRAELGKTGRMGVSICRR